MCPYKGRTAPTITDLIGGQIDLLCDQTTNTTSQIEGQEGQSLWRHHAQAPDHPALRTCHPIGGGPQGLQVTIWHGVRPRGTPAPVLKKLNDASSPRSKT